MVDKVSKSDLIKIAKSKGYSEAQIQKMSFEELNALISNTKVKTEGTVYKGLDGLDSKATNNTSFTGNIWSLKGNITGGKDPFAIEKQNQPTQTHSTKAKADSPKSIADNLFKLADDYSGAVSQKSFKDQLNKINKDNVLDVLNEYEKKSPNESLIEMICNEKGSSSAERQAAIAKVFGEVAKKAKENGVDVQHFQSEFNAESNYQFKKIGFTDASKMNTILNAVVVATKNKASLTPQERKAINSTNPAVLEKQSTGILQHRAKSAQASFDNQMKEDGWAGDVADFTSGLWGSKNRAKFVREDITKFNGQVKQLQIAETKGPNAYKEKFYETFGVEYDAENIAIYKKKEQQNQAAMAVYGVESNFNSTNNKLLKNPKLQEEKTTTTAYTSAGPITNTSVSATKEQVYNRELNNFAQFIGQGDVKNGKAQIEAYMKSKGLDLKKATIDQKYAVMHDRAVSYSKELHKNTMTVTDNKGMAAFTKEYEASYNAAFGVKNDIAKRVTDYNNSQQAGAAIVKNGVIMVGSIAAGVLTGGAGLTLFPAIMATGASAAAVTAGVEVSDRLTSGHVTQGYKNGGFKGALKGAKEALPKEKIEEILKSAGINGATAIAGGLASSGIEVAGQTLKLGKGLKSLAFVSTDIAVGAGAEYVQTGTVTIEGVAFSAVLSASGQIVALKKLGKVDETKTAKPQEVVAHDEAALPLADKAENVPLRTIESKKTNQVNINENPILDNPRIKTAQTEIQTKPVENEIVYVKSKNPFIKDKAFFEGKQIATTEDELVKQLSSFKDSKGKSVLKKDDIKFYLKDIKAKNPNFDTVRFSRMLNNLMPETFSKYKDDIFHELRHGNIDTGKGIDGYENAKPAIPSEFLAEKYNFRYELDDSERHARFSNNNKDLCDFISSKEDLEFAKQMTNNKTNASYTRQILEIAGDNNELKACAGKIKADSSMGGYDLVACVKKAKKNPETYDAFKHLSKTFAKKESTYDTHISQFLDNQQLYKKADSRGLFEKSNISPNALTELAKITDINWQTIVNSKVLDTDYFARFKANGSINDDNIHGFLRLNEEQGQNIQKRSLTDKVQGREKQLSCTEMNKLSLLNDQEWQNVQDRNLLKDIKERPIQFSVDDVSALATIDNVHWDKAKSLFHIKGRENQFSGNEIAELSKLDDSQFNKIKSLLYISGSKKQLSYDNIKDNMEFINHINDKYPQYTVTLPEITSKFSQYNKVKEAQTKLLNKLMEENVKPNSLINAISENDELPKIEKYNKLLDNEKFNNWAIQQLNSGHDIATVEFLSKTQSKLNNEKVNDTTNTEKVQEIALNSEQKPVSYMSSDIRNFENELLSRGVEAKQLEFIEKACVIDGNLHSDMRDVAFDLLELKVPAKEIGEILNLSKVNNEFKIEIVEDFISLKDSGLNPMLRKNVAAINNMNPNEVTSTFNPNSKKQMKAMLEKMPEEQKVLLSERGINFDEIMSKLENNFVKTPSTGATKIAGLKLRSKAKIVGAERIILDKYAKEVPENIWRNPEKFREWAIEKVKTTADFNANPDYTATTYTMINQNRQDGIKAWHEYLTKESTIKDDPFAQLMVMEDVTKELKPDNAAVPPVLSPELFEETFNRVLENGGKGSFSKFYNENSRSMAIEKYSTPEDTHDGIKGRWVSIPKTSINDPKYQEHVGYVQSLSDGTNWCIRFSQAETYIQNGDINFFVDADGKTQVCVREDSPGHIAEIQKRQQNATVPVPYINVINKFVEGKQLKGCEDKIKTAIDAKPKFDELRTDLAKLQAEKRYDEIFQKIGVKVEKAQDGSLILPSYSAKIGDFTLTELGVDENALFANVSEIKGDADFSSSSLTNLGHLKKVGGKFIFEGSNINDIRNLAEINGIKILWNKDKPK